MPSLSWKIAELPQTLAHLVGEVQKGLAGSDWSAIAVTLDEADPSVPKLVLTDLTLNRSLDIAMPIDCRQSAESLLWFRGEWPARFYGLIRNVQCQFPGIDFFSLTLEVYRGALWVHTLNAVGP